MILIVITGFNLSAQDYIGLRTDNYSGSNGMLLNPATPMSGLLPWDINIAAAGFSANNNYIYAVDQNTFTMLNSNGEKIPVGYYHPQTAYGYENLSLQFPSGFVRIDDFAVGLFFTARSAGYLKTEKYQPGIPQYDTIPIGVPTDFPAFTSGMVNWSEIGVNGEFTFADNSSRAIYIGGNLKYLMGFDAMDFDNKQLFTYTRGQTETTITPVDMDFSYSTNLGNGTMGGNNFKVNGNGLGLDAGIFYVIKNSNSNASHEAGYSWKFGASLVDLGFIHFKRNSGDFHLSSTEDVTISNGQIDSINNLEDVNVTGSISIYDNSEASLTDVEFKEMLPAAVTLSADKNLGGGFFVNGLFVRRMPHLNSALIARPNTIAISPRFEKRWWGLTLPLVLYEDKYFHLGTAARIGFLTIGTDNLLSWIVKQNYTGTDIYAGIKINPFWLDMSNISRNARQLDCPKVWH